MVGMAQTLELEGDGGAREVSATPSKSIGTVVAGTYRLTRHIGSGGSSHVFEAEHVRLGKPFAVKLLRPELDPTRQTAQRFRREARAIARLSSEYIVSVVDCGELPDHTPYLVMELLEGEDLRSLLQREGSLPARRAVPIAIEACRALTAAHAAGLVHRDLKPENLFISRRATGEDWCKVLDFGVAKMDASMSTTQGAIVGTVRYMAPEQLADGTKVGAAADLHALGAILYECLSGRAAHAGESIQEVMFSVLNKEPSALKEVPDSVSAVVLQCLAKDAARRPQNARALEELLAGALDVPAAATASQYTLAEDSALASTSFESPVRSRKVTSWLVPIGIGAVLSASALGVWLSGKADQASSTMPPKALTAAERQVTLPAIVPTASATAAPVAAAPASVAAVSAFSGAAKPKATTAHAGVAPKQAAAPRAPTVGNLDSANPYSE